MIIEIVVVVASVILASAIATHFVNAKHRRELEINDIYRQIEGVTDSVKDTEDRLIRRIYQVEESLNREFESMHRKIESRFTDDE